MKIKFSYLNSLLVLVLAVVGTTTTLAGITTSQAAWAAVIPGTEGPDEIVGTPGDDIIDSKGGIDINFGDTEIGDGSGNDVIDSGDGGDVNFGDTGFGDGSGDDIINSGEGNDFNVGDVGVGPAGSGDDIIISGEGNDENYGDLIGASIFPPCQVLEMTL